MTFQFAHTNSSVISSIAYTASDLIINFRNGYSYIYYDVSPTVFERMRLSDSSGRFYNDNIRGFYDFLRVDTDSLSGLVRNCNQHYFQSSFLTAARYDRENQIATIWIRDNSYQYRLHPNCWDEFIAAESAGAYFNNYISRLAERV